MMFAGRRHRDMDKLEVIRFIALGLGIIGAAFGALALVISFTEKNG